MELSEIRLLVADEMQAVNDHILARLRSEVVLINQLGSYIVSGGGKRLRPLMALLSAKACGYRGDGHIGLAAIVELIHTATLLHDDVVDDSKLRRNRETANAIWGNEAAVLVGDFLYTRAFEMMVDLDSMHIMQILASATNTIAEGEVLQLLNCNDPDTSEQRYMDVIHSKTAKLFEAATQIGAVLAGRPADQEAALGAYGMHAGTAFQLIDDVLDYRASADVMGKNVGDDLAEGKPTLPLIYAMRQGCKRDQQVIREAIEQGGLERIEEVLAAIESTGALAYTETVARAEAEKACRCLAVLPESPYKDALASLTLVAVEREA
ncbi:octaprenyl diphosphate synthase [Acidihalobacter ferrooxydans]|uniref:Octaprenyl diphosphate synthase n=1 Tax=Acidihalobacter ferrooxydans TaxID=1765967 RepID=A0A1P8UCZ2_9GAMM|nr:octaprenyl diphosphate synthase [Acidihalobacter ferrooxydans]APZ41727.1 octaprenyl diphosphate synthase [Acidihalobacter ferrooxydans]